MFTPAIKSEASTSQFSWKRGQTLQSHECRHSARIETQTAEQRMLSPTSSLPCYKKEHKNIIHWDEENYRVETLNAGSLKICEVCINPELCNLFDNMFCLLLLFNFLSHFCKLPLL